MYIHTYTYISYQMSFTFGCVTYNIYTHRLGYRMGLVQFNGAIDLTMWWLSLNDSSPLKKTHHSTSFPHSFIHPFFHTPIPHMPILHSYTHSPFFTHSFPHTPILHSFICQFPILHTHSPTRPFYILSYTHSTFLHTPIPHSSHTHSPHAHSTFLHMPIPHIPILHSFIHPFYIPSYAHSPTRPFYIPSYANSPFFTHSFPHTPIPHSTFLHTPIPGFSPCTATITRPSAGVSTDQACSEENTNYLRPHSNERFMVSTTTNVGLHSNQSHHISIMQATF